MSTRIADPRLPLPAEGLSRRDLLSIAWRDRRRASRRALDPRASPRDGVPVRGHPARRARVAEIPAAREALEEADRLEALLSVFRETSEISRINQQAGIGAITVEQRRGGAAVALPAAVSRTPAARSTSPPRRSAAAGASSGATAACPPTARSIRPWRSSGWTPCPATPATNRVSLVDAGRRSEPRRHGQGLRRAGDWRRALAPGRARSAGLRRQQLDPRARRHGRRLEGGRDGRSPTRRRARAPAAAQRRARHQRRRRAVRRGQRPPVRPRPRSAHWTSGVRRLNATVVSADAATADALATAFFVGGIDLARRTATRIPARWRSSPRTTSPGVPALSGATVAPLWRSCEPHA